MSEFAGVDPQRVRLLANKLRDLADTLQREAPNIRNKFGDWHGTINQSLLSQQVTQVRTDATDMAKRADEALNLLHNPRFVDPNDPHKDWINIPWDVSKINTSAEAQQEALDLKNAFDNPNDPSSRATIKEVAQSLADHQDDPAYMQAFMANGGMDQAARAARILHGQDGTHNGVVLSKDSEAMLAQFAQGVQTATTMAANGTITLPPDYLNKLTKPAGDDMWSVGMLFKYGPDGSKWDPKVLSAVGGSMLDWRQTHEMRPDYEAPDFPYSAGGYVGDRSAWYTTLGIHVDYRDSGGDHITDMQSIDANDPSMILMQRVSENAEASRDLLTGPDGKQHAADLVSDKWHTPGNDFDDQKWPAAVITAATSDRKDHGQASMQAAVNVINATAAEYNKEKGASSYDKGQYPGPTASMTHSLATLFGNYGPDFANSHRMPNSQDAYSGGDTTDPYTLIVGRQTTVDFLSQIMKNKDDAGFAVNSVNSQITLTAAQGVDRPGAQTYLHDLAELRGEIAQAGKNNDLNSAALLDAAHKNEVMWLNAVGGFVASVPGVGTGGDLVKASIWGALPIVSAADRFSTDNAANVDAASKPKFFDDATTMRVPLVQGLIQSGTKLPAPPGHPEWAYGDITITSEQDRDDFNGWWAHIQTLDGRKLDQIDTQMGDGFYDGTH